MSPAPLHPARRVAGTLGGDLSWYALVWAGVGAVIVAVNLVPNAVWGEIEGSAWSDTSIVFQYALLAGGIMVGAGYMPVYLSHGITRRDFTTGALVALTGLAVGGAIAVTAGFVVEHLAFAAADLPHVLDSDRDMHIYDRPDQYGLVLVELLGLYVTHALAGLVIIASVARLGVVVGAPGVLAGVGIALAAEMALASGVGDVLLRWLDVDPPSVGVGVAVAAGLAALGALLARALLAGVELASRDAPQWR